MESMTRRQLFGLCIGGVGATRMAPIAVGDAEAVACQQNIRAGMKTLSKLLHESDDQPRWPFMGGDEIAENHRRMLLRHAAASGYPRVWASFSGGDRVVGDAYGSRIDWTLYAFRGGADDVKTLSWMLYFEEQNRLSEALAMLRRPDRRDVMSVALLNESAADTPCGIQPQWPLDRMKRAIIKAE